MQTLEKKHTPFFYKVLFFIGISFAILSLGFIGMIGYYTYQINFGDRDTTDKLNTSFSTITSRSTYTAQYIPTWKEIIHDHNPTIGSSSAPITIITFIDFECPFCKATHQTIEEIKERYAPVIRVVFKHFPIEQLHPNARRTALAATCAQASDIFWPYYNKLFTTTNFQDESLISIATELGIDSYTFTSCLESGFLQSDITTDLTDGATIGVQGTPTYIVNGYLYEGSLTPEQWDSILLPLLQ